MTTPFLNHLAIKVNEHSGRLHSEDSCTLRNDFDRDRDRIIHSNAFRRLAYKTQVFVYHEGDHYRSRLTHSLEVAQIARSMARQLGLNEAITEAIALAHDLGHPPFGHAGEDALDDLMAQWGGFDHNAQAFSRVTYLEQGYAGFNGLNLTFECLDGILKHNGPIKNSEMAAGSHLEQVLTLSGVESLIGKDARYPYPFLEAQLAAIADDIAYTAHDVDDGLRAGILTIEQLEALSFTGKSIHHIRQKHKNITKHQLVFELKRDLITCMVNDITANIVEKTLLHRLTKWRDVTRFNLTLAQFSPKMAQNQKEVFDFLFQSMYRHPNVVKIREEKDSILRKLFLYFLENPHRLDDIWPEGYSESWMKSLMPELDDHTIFARKLCDFISGMTDRYAEMVYNDIK